MKLCRKKLHFYASDLHRCPECYYIASKKAWQKYHKNNVAKRNAMTAKWYASNKNRKKEYDKQRKDKALRSRQNKIWRANNKERHKKLYSDWAAENRDFLNYKSMCRYAAKIKRTPKWLTADHHSEIKQFYTDATYLTYYSGTKFHVDHVVPLNGKHISGLHVPWNLQLLTQSENCAKSNKLEKV